jgi:hypothetical protein
MEGTDGGRIRFKRYDDPKYDWISVFRNLKENIKCGFKGHEISAEDEKKLFKIKEINTTCSECGTKICAQINKENPIQYFVRAT